MNFRQIIKSCCIISGIFNCGTGMAHTFNEFMEAVIAYPGSGHIRYVPFPDILRGKYQSYTKADTTKLLAAGYDRGFTPLKEAVFEYCRIIEENGGYFK